MSKIIGNTTATPNPRPDWEQIDENKADYIKNKPQLGTLAAKSVVDKADLEESVQTSLNNADMAKSKLDGIEEGANAYTLPTAGTSLGGVKTGGDVTISSGIITVNDDSHNHTISNVDNLQTALDSKVPTSRTINGKPLSSNISLTASDVGALSTSQKGATNGLAELDDNGRILISQLPSYVDDVIEATTKASFPATGEVGKIYVDTTTNITYRWGGSAYVEISPSLALGTTSSTAYRGDWGNAAYTHSQKTSGNPHGVTKSDVGLGNVENKSSETIRSELTKSNVTTALGYTPPTTDTTYSVATTSKDGLMSATDKTRVDGIENIALSVKTAKGNALTLNTAKAPFGSLTLYGKTEKSDNTLTTAGSDGSIKLTKCGKNLLEIPPNKTFTYNGVNWSTDNNGRIYAKGTANGISNTSPTMPIQILGLPKGSYILTGSSEGLQSNLRITRNGNTSYPSTTKEKPSLSFEIYGDETDVRYYAQVSTETSVDTYIEPMIRHASETDTYEPYNGTSIDFSTPKGLASVGDICDTLTVRADGTGTLTKRFVTKVFDGSDDENWRIPSTGIVYIYAWDTAFYKSKILCDSYDTLYEFRTDEDNVITAYAGAGQSLFIYDSTNAVNIDTWRAHLASNPITVIYEMLTPTVTELSAEEVNAFLSLTSNKGITNVFTDDICDIECTYAVNSESANYLGAVVEGVKQNSGNIDVVYPNAFSNVTVGSTTIAADSISDTLTLAAGNNITLTPDATNDKITIAATNTVYTHPTTSGNKHIPSGGSSGQILRWSADGTATWGAENGTTYSVAMTSANGLMSSTDKAKLDGIAAGANAYTLPTASSSTLGGVKTTSTVTSTSGLTPCPIISGVPYYKDTNTSYTLSSFGVTSTAAELNVLDGITATTTELNYVDGVTSNIQTQLDSKAASSHNHAATNITSGTLSSDRLPTVPITKGGTGATTVADATKNLFNTTIASPSYIFTLPSSGWAGGYTSISQLKTTLGLGTYTLGKSVPSDAVFTDTTYSNMTGATSSAAGKAGLVPAPASGKQTSFLRGDGTWVVPTNTTYSNFVKSGSGAQAGLVPAPSTTAGTTKYLREDGTWTVPPDTNTTYSAATTSAAGLMSASDKSKLDGIATGANAYTHPSYTARTGKPTANQTPAFGGTATVSQITSDATGHVTAANDRTITIPSTLSNGTGTAGLIKTTSTVTSNSGYTACPVISGVPYYKDTNTTYSAATTSAAGLMSAADKKKLDLGSGVYVSTSAPTDSSVNVWLDTDADPIVNETISELSDKIDILYNKGTVIYSGEKTLNSNYDGLYHTVASVTAKAGCSYLVFAFLYHTNTSTIAMNLRLDGVDMPAYPVYDSSVPRGVVLQCQGYIRAKTTDTVINLNTYTYSNSSYTFTGGVYLVELGRTN